jgi:hypothetical protein
LARTYELGKLIIDDHESQTLTGAFGLKEDQFDDIVNTARESWNFEDTVSESVEFMVKKLKNSELVLGLLILGRIWEENSIEEEDEK